MRHIPIDSGWTAAHSDEKSDTVKMTIPLDTFGPETGIIWPELPWLNPRQRPIDWFRQNARSFLYEPGHILKEAVEYSFGDGPYQPGVYFLICHNRIIYVGHSNGISRRLMQHFQKLDMWGDEGWIFDRYWCFGGVPELFIQEVEGYYIDTLQPPLNAKQHCCESFKAFISDEVVT